MGYDLGFLWCCFVCVVVGELIGCLEVCVVLLVRGPSLDYDYYLWLRCKDLS